MIGERSLPTTFVDDPKALETARHGRRAVHEQMRDEGANERMLRIASDYERLAQRVLNGPTLNAVAETS